VNRSTVRIEITLTVSTTAAMVLKGYDGGAGMPPISGLELALTEAVDDAEAIIASTLAEYALDPVIGLGHTEVKHRDPDGEPF